VRQGPFSEAQEVKACSVECFRPQEGVVVLVPLLAELWQAPHLRPRGFWLLDSS
jgi:hypothetical protein